jgi:hypothetical protein
MTAEGGHHIMAARFAAECDRLATAALWQEPSRGKISNCLANKDKREYGHRCDQQDGEHDGPN